MEEVRDNDFLINVLKKLDFFSTENAIENDFPEIVFTKNTLSNLHPKHYIALEFAENLEADAVYFKYYDDNRYCVPQVYFYNSENIKLKKLEISEIHRNVYSSNQVPLICIIDKASISLFDTRRPIKIDSNGEFTNEECLIDNSDSFEKIELLSKYFNAKKLNSGDFWESNEASKHFKNNKSVYEKLVDALSVIRKNFHIVFENFENFNDNKKKATDFADEILFKCILIKYLEENELNRAQQFYKDSNIEQNSLSAILESGKLIKLLDALEYHFNGSVFFIDDDKRELLEKLNLSSLALCLDGKYGSNSSLYLWEMYSFKHIPIELISNFYEEFIPKDKENSGTVYTPSHLVNLLIDECLPLSDKEEHLNFNVRLADVSCGSGIFITTAFKRLVQRWRVKNRNKKTGKLAMPSLDVVKKILSKNIFGVDKNDTATKLAKFSLQLALCQLVPKNELWTWNEDRVFKDLQDTNIFSTDFFDFLTEEKYFHFHNSMDLIIGNPPFQAIGEKKYKEYKESLKKVDFKLKVEIPRKQLALLFLETSPILLNKNGQICFVQKSTSLLYNKDKISIKYKNNFFNSNTVTQIIDFTLLKDYLFENATVETCAVFYNKGYKEDYTTLHIVSKLLRNTKEGISFEFDYYNFYEVSKSTILEDDTIWRCNLLGGNRLNHLLKKLNKKTNNQTNLKDYLYNFLGIEKEQFGVGFQISSKDKSADFITDKRILLNINFENDKLEYTSFPKTQKFGRIRNSKLYEHPLITIKKNISNSKIPVVINEIDTAFDERIVGISFSGNDSKEYKKLYNKLIKNQKSHILQTISSCSQFYYRGDTAILKQDIDNWSIPLNKEEIMLSDSEIIIMDDVLDYIYPSWQFGENAKINKNQASREELIQFGEVFNQSFNSIYKKENKEQKLAVIYEGSTFFALEFEFTDKKITKPKQIDKTEADKQIESLIFSHGKNTLINKVLRIYSPNKITLIKPKKLRFWLKSIALQDSDEIFDDIIENGLK